MGTIRWYLTIRVYGLLCTLRLHHLAERFAKVSGLHLALRRLLWDLGESPDVG